MSDERGMNPYGQLAPVTPGAGEIIQSSRAMQEVQAAIIMAKHDRRDPVRAAESALEECKRPTLAMTAIYTYPRGGTNVEGPSIRLAEAIARSWGNMQYGLIEVGREGDESSMLAYAWDLQSNNMARQEFKVKHTRDTRNGSKTLTDERDIYETTANAGARRLRACILKLIPGDVVDACIDRCKLTLEQAMGKVEEATPRMLEKFTGIGVSQQMIEKRLKKSISAISYQDLVNLGNVFNSIRDGMGGVEDYFETETAPVIKPAEGSRAEAARGAAAKAAGRPQGATQAPAPTPAPVQKAPDAPMPREAPKVTKATPEKTEALNGLRAEIYKYIAAKVPGPDRAWFTASADSAGSIEDLERIRKEVAANYEVF
jgi:hypothetical protein